MNYYIGIDTYDLGNEFNGYGVALVYGITERGSYYIAKEIKSQDKHEFYAELEMLKQQYQPHEILEWD